MKEPKARVLCCYQSSQQSCGTSSHHCAWDTTLQLKNSKLAMLHPAVAHHDQCGLGISEVCLCHGKLRTPQEAAKNAVAQTDNDAGPQCVAQIHLKKQDADDHSHPHDAYAIEDHVNGCWGLQPVHVHCVWENVTTTKCGSPFTTYMAHRPARLRPPRHRFHVRAQWAPASC